MAFIEPTEPAEPTEPEAVLIVVWFEGDSLDAADFGGRDEIEDPLDEALTGAGLGCVSGGGGGFRGTNIDVEIEDEADVAEAIRLIQRVLKALTVPPQTTITKYGATDGDKITYSLYDRI